jgi:NADPH:quinone reductase-like Zn-dependent oxidoreductase
MYIETSDDLPAGLGAEAAGTIEALGPGVTGWAVGQAVSVVPAFSQRKYPMYGERALAPVDALVARPDGVDAVTGAAVWMPYLTAYGAMVEVAGVRSGEATLITAASSSVGLAAIHLANRLGARPIAVSRTAAKRDALIAQGAAEVVAADAGSVAAQVLALTGGAGVAHTFDAVAGPAVAELMRATAPGGTLLLWGALSGEPTPFPAVDLGMPAVAMRTYLVHEITRRPERLRRALAFVRAGLADGAFRPVVDRVFDLADAAAAHAYVESGEQVGKVILMVG